MELDLFDANAVTSAAAACDAVIHLATNIPTGVAMARKGAWKMNDRLRTEAAANLASAVIDGGAATYIGESITFPYVDNGSDWIDESQACTYHDGSRSALNAEAAAQRVTDHGLTGVVLRFAMFHAVDSPHIRTFRSAAKRGIAPFVGVPEGHQSFIDTDDAARAVVAALDAPPGIYNVAEPRPRTRAEHCAALAAVAGKKRLRFLPAFAQKLGGEELVEMGRSQRISSQSLQEATTWEPEIDVVERWNDIS